jgi:uncharacterized protein YukE
MGQPGNGLTTADIPALEQLGKDMSVSAHEIDGIADILRRIPPPNADAYGWSGTADAMSAVLSSWTAELGVMKQAMDQLASSVSATAENLRWADDEARRRVDGNHGH